MVGSFVFFILHCVISGMNILVIYLYRTKIVHIITPFDISIIHLFPLLLLLFLLLLLLLLLLLPGTLSKRIWISRSRVCSFRRRRLAQHVHFPFRVSLDDRRQVSAHFQRRSQELGRAYAQDETGPRLDRISRRPNPQRAETNLIMCDVGVRRNNGSGRSSSRSSSSSSSSSSHVSGSGADR